MYIQNGELYEHNDWTFTFVVPLLKVTFGNDACLDCTLSCRISTKVLEYSSTTQYSIMKHWMATLQFNFSSMLSQETTYVTKQSQSIYVLKWLNRERMYMYSNMYNACKYTDVVMWGYTCYYYCMTSPVFACIMNWVLFNFYLVISPKKSSTKSKIVKYNTRTINVVIKSW